MAESLYTSVPTLVSSGMRIKLIEPVGGTVSEFDDQIGHLFCRLEFGTYVSFTLFLNLTGMEL